MKTPTPWVMKLYDYPITSGLSAGSHYKKVDIYPTHLSPDETFDLTESLSEDDAAFIVEAVNSHDRLRAELAAAHHALGEIDCALNPPNGGNYTQQQVLALVENLRSDVTRYRGAFESANSALEDAQTGRPLRDCLGRTDSYTLTVEKLRATRAELAASEALVDALNAQRAADAVASLRAVEEAGEEVREACAKRIENATATVFEEMTGTTRMTVNVGAEFAAAIRATSLKATPLRERIAELESWRAVHSIENGCNSRTAEHLGERAEKAEAERDALKAELAEMRDAFGRVDDERLYQFGLSEQRKAQVKRLTAALKDITKVENRSNWCNGCSDDLHLATEALKESDHD